MNEAIETGNNTSPNFIELTSRIVASFVGSGSNAVTVAEVPNLISQVHATLSGLGTVSAEPTIKQEPAVSVRKSIADPSFIICLEDGKKLKMLKRHLSTAFGMTPDQYRAKWGLSADYPMTAANYTTQRRELAKKIGLGTRRNATAALIEGAAPKRAKPAATRKPGRPKGSGNKAAATA